MLDAVRNGATFQPAGVRPGVAYWKLLSADGPEPWGGRHSIFIDVWDEQGRRMVGVPVTFWWADGSQTKTTEAKSGEPWAVDFPMFAAGASYGIRIDNELDSDQLFGMGLLAGQPHVVYKLIFQRTMQREEAPTQPEPPTVPGKDKIQLIMNGEIVWQN